MLTFGPVIGWPGMLIVTSTYDQYRFSTIVENRLVLLLALLCALASVAILIRRGWQSERPERNSHLIGWAIAAAIAVTGTFSVGRAYYSRRRSTLDKVIFDQAFFLEKAAEQYFLENGVSVARYSDLVGPTNYIKSFEPIEHETYPTAYTQGSPVIVTGVAGLRTITYQP